MKRNMDLVRSILLELEAFQLRSGAIAHLEVSHFKEKLSDNDDDEIAYHLNLIQESGFINSGKFRPMSGIGFSGFTWSGHDLLDSIRDPEIWSATKGAVDEAGGISLDLLKSLTRKEFNKRNILRAVGSGCGCGR